MADLDNPPRESDLADCLLVVPAFNEEGTLRGVQFPLAACGESRTEPAEK